MVKRSTAEKAPVRKATPSKTSSAVTAGKTARPSKLVKKGAATKKTGSAASTATPAKPSKRAAPPASTPTTVKQPKKTASATVSKSKTRQTVATKPATTMRPAPSPPRQPTRDEAAALKAFERAHKEFTRGRFAEARMLFRGLIDQHGGVSEVTARARTYLAIAESRLRSESALPRDAEALYDRGVIELNRGEYVAAQELFERALKRDAEAADVHYALAATRARLGSIELALEALERALGIKPSLRVRAQHDQDLVTLRNEPEFERLVFASRH